MSKPKSLRRRYRTRLEEGFPETMKLVIGDEEIEYESTSPLFDEIIAHRISMIPIVTDLELFSFKNTI